ncbi:MAG: hypothetical protein WCS99_14710 [Limisphaerales bacterium]
MERKLPSEPAGVPPERGETLKAGRMRGFGQRGLIAVLLVIAVLWIHELFVDPEVRQGWKLYVLIILIPLGLVASLSLALAWAVDRREEKKHRDGGPDRI